MSQDQLIRDRTVGFDPGTATRALEEIARSLGKLADQLVPDFSERPPLPKPWAPPNDDDTYRRALAGLMGLVGRDVRVSWRPLVGNASLGVRGALSVPACSRCDEPQDSENQLSFLVGDGENAGLFRVSRAEVTGVDPDERCGCMLLETVGGLVAVLVEDCEQHRPGMPHDGEA
jgi:hypothetical protein